MYRLIGQENSSKSISNEINLRCSDTAAKQALAVQKRDKYCQSTNNQRFFQDRLVPSAQPRDVHDIVTYYMNWPRETFRCPISKNAWSVGFPFHYLRKCWNMAKHGSNFMIIYSPEETEHFTSHKQSTVDGNKTSDRWPRWAETHTHSLTHSNSFFAETADGISIKIESSRTGSDGTAKIILHLVHHILTSGVILLSYVISSDCSCRCQM